jgi:DNA topoisomerase VI subunit A
MKPKRLIPEWLEEEIRDAKREVYYGKNEEREEQEELNDWINRGGY